MDAAFAKVPKATLAALGKDKALLKSVLLYHVAKGKVTAAKVVELKSVKTLQGGMLPIRVSGGKVFVVKAQVVTPDVMASNGVIHVINRVLIHRTASRRLKPASAAAALRGGGSGRAFRLRQRPSLLRRHASVSSRSLNVKTWKPAIRAPGSPSGSPLMSLSGLKPPGCRKRVTKLPCLRRKRIDLPIPIRVETRNSFARCTAPGIRRRREGRFPASAAC